LYSAPTRLYKHCTKRRSSVKTFVSRIAVGTGLVAVLLVAALPVAAADSKAMIRVLHASPDAPAVDI